MQMAVTDEQLAARRALEPQIVTAAGLAYGEAAENARQQLRLRRDPAG